LGKDRVVSMGMMRNGFNEMEEKLKAPNVYLTKRREKLRVTYL
jgi:hypothetical protein